MPPFNDALTQELKGKPVRIRHGRATVKRVTCSIDATVLQGWEGGTVDTRKSGDLPEDLVRSSFAEKDTADRVMTLCNRNVPEC